jgi:predicted adenylyl cyclase CyaB
VARNLEIKVGCDESSLASVRKRAEEIGANQFIVLQHVDTYFAASQGRLKVREIEEECGQRSAELITYRRPDENGSRWSDFQRITLDVDAIGEVKQALRTACGVSATVDKKLEVAKIRRTRIHLDRVAGLGCFIELETVAGPGDDDAGLAEEHAEFIRALGLDALPVIPGSYGDLVSKTKEV